MDLRVVPDAAAAAAAACQELLATVSAGGHVALAGGSTPRAAFELAAKAADVDWRAATLWMGDERCVPADHEHANQRMVAEALLDRLAPDNRPEFVAVRGDEGPDAAADHYEAEVRNRLGDAPEFDLVLLGLGPDSHTASLFPGKPAVEERSRLVAPVPEPGMEPRVPRITLTLPVINAARRVIFLVAGADKAEAVLRAFGPEPDPESPASHVRPDPGLLVVLVDEAAASRL